MPTRPDVLDTDQLSEADCTRVEDAVWEFEGAWNRSFRAGVSRPELGDFLPPAEEPVLRRAIGIELAAIDLDHRLKRGEPICVEDYLERFPEFRDDRSGIRGLIETEYRCALFQGYDPPVDHYAARFPDACDAALLDELRALRRDPENDPNEPRFRIIRFHRHGGLGEVFEAYDRELKRPVALKEVRGDQTDQDERWSKLAREAEITSRLEHPGIVAVHSLGRHPDGRPFYVMRFVAGDNRLEEAIHQYHRPADPGPDRGTRAMVLRQLLRRFLDVCNVVAYATSQRVLHLDIKPSNILLGPFGETLLVDWGEAQPLGRPQPGNAQATMPRPLPFEGGVEVPSGPMPGTPAYMSPEQAAGQVDRLGPASDVYGLGATLYHLLTGKAPFPNPQTDAELVEVLRRAQEGDFPPPRQVNRGVAPALAAICRKAMARDPLARYPNPRDLADDLERWLADQPVSVYPDTLSQRLARWLRHHRTWAKAGALTLLSFTLVSVVSALAVDQARREAVQRSADLAEGQGVSLCEQGEIGRGILWLARSLEIAPGDATDLRRVNLAGWCRKLCPLTASLTVPGGAEPLAFDPGGQRVLMAGPNHSAELWELATNQPIGRQPMRHAKAVVAAAFSPDGRTVVTGSEDGFARLWDVAEGAPSGLIAELRQHRGAVRVVTFSPDGRTVVTASQDGTAWVSHAASGRPISGPLRHAKAIQAAIFSPDGQAILTGSADGTARLWKAATGEPIGQPLPHGGPILAVAFSPNGQRVLTGGADGRAQVWDATTGQRIGRPLGPHPGEVRVVGFSPNPESQTALTATAYGTAYLWNTETCTRIGQSLDHRRIISAAMFSPDGQAILTGSADGTTRLWDAATGQPLGPPLPHHDRVKVIGFSRDGTTILTASRDGTARRWGLPPRVTLLPHAHIVNNVAFSPDGRMILTACGNPRPVGQARLWDVATGKPLGDPMPHQKPVMAAAFSPDGQAVLTRAATTAQLWRVPTGKPLGDPMPHPLPINAMAFSPDGQAVLTGSEDGTARLWDVATGKRIGLDLRHGAAINVVAFPNGSTVLTGGDDGIAQLWDVARGRRMGPPLRHLRAIRAVAFSPDGRTILTGSADGTAQLWDAATGKPNCPPLPHHKAITAVAFSPRGRIILTASQDGTARLWQSPAGTAIGRPMPHQDAVNAAAFSRPDGRMVVTASEDGTGRLWDAATGKPISPPIRHQWAIKSVSFSPDGNTVLTGSSDRTAQLWEVPAPLRGEVDRIALWTQVVTGMELDSDGAIHVLATEDWRARHRDLHERVESRPSLDPEPSDVRPFDLRVLRGVVSHECRNRLPES
jgi:WD40 repeat protein/serine/threonine protein kinase